MASKHFRVSEIVSELISPLRALKYIRVYAFEAITSCQTHDVIRDGLPLAPLNVRAAAFVLKIDCNVVFGPCMCNKVS